MNVLLFLLDGCTKDLFFKELESIRQICFSFNFNKIENHVKNTDFNFHIDLGKCSQWCTDTVMTSNIKVETLNELSRVLLRLYSITPPLWTLVIWWITAAMLERNMYTDISF